MARGAFVVFAWQREIAGLDPERPLPSDITAADRHVGLTLSLWMDNFTGRAWPSLTTLANATGRKRDTVVKSLHHWERLSYLEISHGGIAGAGRMKRANTYVCKSPYGGLKWGDSSPSAGSAKSPSGMGQVPPGGLELLSSNSQQNYSPRGAPAARGQKQTCPICDVPVLRPTTMKDHLWVTHSIDESSLPLVLADETSPF